MQLVLLYMDLLRVLTKREPSPPAGEDAAPEAAASPQNRLLQLSQVGSVYDRMWV